MEKHKARIMGNARVTPAVLEGMLKEDLGKEVTFEQRLEGGDEWVMWISREEHGRQREQQV